MPRRTKPDSPEAKRLLEAYELISGYVTHGSMDTDDQFDGWFGRLRELVPRDLVRPVSVVHRAILIPANDLAAIRAGGTFALRPRVHGSWSRSGDAALRCLRGRFATMRDDMAAIVVTKGVDPDRVVVDVRAVYEALGFDADCVEDWERYASWEEEVIVRQDASMLNVSAADVSVAHLAGDRNALRPIRGERVWFEEEGQLLVIDDVPDDQPGKGEGTWTVRIGGRGPATVAWDGRADAWEISGPMPEAGQSPSP